MKPLPCASSPLPVLFKGRGGGVISLVPEMFACLLFQFAKIFNMSVTGQWLWKGASPWVLNRRPAEDIDKSSIVIPPPSLVPNTDLLNPPSLLSIDLFLGINSHLQLVCSLETRLTFQKAQNVQKLPSSSDPLQTQKPLAWRGLIPSSVVVAHLLFFHKVNIPTFLLF